MTRRLRLQFDQVAEFRREFERNIAKGGAFVPGASAAELREVVEVEIVLPFCGERRTLEAEVVHVIDAGAAAGAAVQFLRSAPELRRELSGLLERAAAPPPPVPAPGARALGELEEALDLEIGELGNLASEEAPPETGPPAASPPPANELGGDFFGISPPAALEPPPAPPTPSIAERRGSPRAAARLPASLDGPNARIEGLTRDLSETGALISADASELPPGKSVRLALQHPDTGDRVEVEGRVVRHVETEGTVAAVSVLFDVPPARKQEVAQLVHAARTAHQQRSASGITGRIEELGMPNLIQMLGRSSPQGTLSVQNGEEEGVLAFESGALRYVRLGATRSLKALARLLLWREGSFEFHAHVAPLEEEDPPLRLEAALLEATRRIDEAQRAQSPRFAPATRFRVDREVLAASEALDKTEEAVLDLATAGFTVRRIFDVIPEDDAEVSAALLMLVERGVLVPCA